MISASFTPRAVLISVVGALVFIVIGPFILFGIVMCLVLWNAPNKESRATPAQPFSVLEDIKRHPEYATTWHSYRVQFRRRIEHPSEELVHELHAAGCDPLTWAFFEVFIENTLVEAAASRELLNKVSLANGQECELQAKIRPYSGSYLFVTGHINVKGKDY